MNERYDPPTLDEQAAAFVLCEEEERVIDRALLAVCSSQWRTGNFIAGTVMMQLEGVLRSIPDFVYMRRLELLAQAHDLEVQRPRSGFGRSEYRLPHGPRPRMTRTEIDAWADAYIRAQGWGSRSKHLPRAISDFMLGRPSTPHPEDRWLAILEVLAREPGEERLSVLAAGPLEDLINEAGPEFIDRIESEARRSPSFRELLRGVWESGTPEIWARVDAAYVRSSVP